MTALFDSNAHPSLANADGKGSFADLALQLQQAGFSGACAVALPGKDGFAPMPYIARCRQAGYFPVAAWPNTAAETIDSHMATLREMGFTAIKIHPRLSGLAVRDNRYAKTLAAAASFELVVFHCSYQFAADSRLHPTDPLPYVMDAVAASPALKMVLLHGGTVELLRYAEAIRGNKNLLLDLSFTLNRYEGSSLDQDISHLFRTFDQRICLGSDYPDYGPLAVRARFDALAQGLPEEKRQNIGWRNITALLGIASKSATHADC